MVAELLKEKLIAVAVHGVITLIVAGAAAALIFLLWFPHPFELMVGGVKLFALVLGCDLVLGPLVSFVIYSSKKSRRELVLDYSVIAAIQLAALFYGVSVVAQSRPVFVLFAKDRLEVITAIELSDTDFTGVKDARFKSRSWTGPKLAAIEFPTTPEEHNAIVLSVLAGKDITMMPKYYRSYDSMIEIVNERLGSVGDLIKRKPDQNLVIESAINEMGMAERNVGWLPVKSRFGFWMAFINKSSGYPIRYLPIDPY